VSDLPPILPPPLPASLPPPLPSAEPTAAGPVAASERIETLDVLRGFALFGILLVNMAIFSWPIYKVMLTQADWQGLDQVSDVLVRIFAEGKFYALFSFLFGLGAAIQMERASARGVSFAGRYSRRLLVLLGIGLVHAFLIWEGDILVLYAAVGFLLVPFRECRPRTLLIWAGVSLAIPVVLFAGIGLLMALGSLVPEIQHMLERETMSNAAEYARLTEQDLAAYGRGTWGEIFLARGRNVVLFYAYTPFIAPVVFAMFLLGTYAGRRGIFRDVPGHAGLLRRVAVAGWLVGLPLNVVYAALHAQGDETGFGVVAIAASAVSAVGGPLLALGYAASLTLLLRRELWQRALLPVAAAGRMGLTNYLLQSLVCTTLFYSYGLAWYGTVGRLNGLLLAVVIYVAQLGLSVAWLRCFQFGPAEWVWRSLTYGRRQPMRRERPG
jgi:uncharacterized protein